MKRSPVAFLALSALLASPAAFARIKIGDSATYIVKEGINAWEETHEVISINEWTEELGVRVTRVGGAGTNTEEQTWDLAATRLTESLFDNCTSPENNGTIETMATPGGNRQVCHLKYEDPNNYDEIEAWIGEPDVLPQGIAKKIVGVDDPGRAKTYELKNFLKY